MDDNWIPKGGDRVAVVRNDRHFKSVQFRTVERVGKRDIVLDDGQRFSAARLAREEGGAWGWTVRLMDPDCPFVAKLKAEIAHDRKVAAARGACDRFARREAGVTAFDVILALAPLTGLADVIAALPVEGQQ